MKSVDSSDLSLFSVMAMNTHLSGPDKLAIRVRTLSYVQRLDFSRNTVFGVYDEDLNLLGVGHLVFRPKETHPALLEATAKTRIAEFGVSVVPYARGQGIGTKLFERAAVHCRNEDVDVLYMHGLASNQAMIHVARKVGMEVRRDRSEADVYLQLLPTGAGSMLDEVTDE